MNNNESGKKFSFFKLIGIIIAIITPIALSIAISIKIINTKANAHEKEKIRLTNEYATEHEKTLRLEERIESVLEELSSSEAEKETLKEKIEELMAKEEVVFDSATIMEEVSNIGELATVEYFYTNVGTIDSKKVFFSSDVKIPFSEKSVVISMDGVIKVGIDVTKVKIETDETTKTITVTIPEAKILSNELDEDSLFVHTEEGGLFNDVTVQDSADIRKEIKDKSEQNLKKNGIYDKAEGQAKLIIQGLIEAVPGVKESYQIEFIEPTHDDALTKGLSNTSEAIMRGLNIE